MSEEREREEYYGYLAEQAERDRQEAERDLEEHLWQEQEARRPATPDGGREK